MKIPGHSPYVTRVIKEVTCPYCFAKLGESCSTIGVHQARMQAAPFKVDDCYPVKK